MFRKSTMGRALSTVSGGLSTGGAPAGSTIGPLRDLSADPSCTRNMAPWFERCPMSDDYEHGRRDGLRLALAVLAAEEAKWAALLGESSAWRTNLGREVRHKALQVAQKRCRPCSTG